MINYPLKADTFKTQDRLLYSTYDAVGINMLKYNNDSSNAFRIIDAACYELDSSSFDINYQMNFTLSNVDFISIDRVNKFNVDDIKLISYDKNSGLFDCSEIDAYSSYTNKQFKLKLCDRFIDFVRHSFPCDAFLENTGFVSDTYKVVTLQPDVETELLIKGSLSRITLNILSAQISPIGLVTQNYDPQATDNIYPYFIVKGLDKNYKEATDKIYIDRLENLTSKKEFLRITNIRLSGLTSSVSVKVEPYIKNELVPFTQKYVDREEQHVFDTVCTIEQYDKLFLLLRKNIENSFLAEYTILEKIDLDLAPTDNILDYHIDNNNHIIYMIVEEAGVTRCLYVYPLIMPYSRKNLNLLKNTEQQSIKVEYFKDNLFEKYVVDIFPSEKAHGVDSISIYQREIFDPAKFLGPYKLSSTLGQQLYKKGDVVYFNNENWLCLRDHSVTKEYANPLIFDTNDSRYYEDRNSCFYELENIINWKKEVTLLRENIIIDLLRFNIETNKFEFKFSDLFKISDECILQIEVTGVKPCSTQILLQNKKLKRFFSKTLAELFENINPSDLFFTDGTVFPVLNNQSELLVDKITSYKYNPINILEYHDFKLQYITSRNYVSINGHNIVPVFDTFFFDEAAKKLITSDTITHIFNPEILDPQTVNNTGNVVSGNVDIDPSPAVVLEEVAITDKEDNVLLER